MLTINYKVVSSWHYTIEIELAEKMIAASRTQDVVVDTGSEHFILRICKEVRLGKLRTDEVVFNAFGRQYHLDVKGDFIEPWLDGLFEADFYLRFAKE